MSKLLSLKRWLTVPEAAKHLSIAFGEDVTSADVLYLALDGRLRISVDFVNGTTACRGKVVHYTKGELGAAIASNKLPEDLKWFRWPPGAMAQMNPKLSPQEAEERSLMLMSIRIGPDRYLTLEDDVTTLWGIWDLPMVGSERLDVEHTYQMLAGGPEVTAVNLDGTFVERNDGPTCQLQTSYDDNEYQAGSTENLKKLKQRIADHGISPSEAEKLLDQHKEDRKKFLEERMSKPESQRYFPADGLPEDSVLVVRTKALREFEASISESSENSENPVSTNSRDHVSDKLAFLNQAATRFWANVDRDNRGAHPKNSDVAAWLVERGYSTTLADKAVSIIRPEWAPSGRKPEE